MEPPLVLPSPQEPVLWSPQELVLPSQQELTAPPTETMMQLGPMTPAAQLQVPQAWLQTWPRVWLRPRVQASIRAWG